MAEFGSMNTTTNTPSATGSGRYDLDVTYKIAGIVGGIVGGIGGFLVALLALCFGIYKYIEKRHSQHEESGQHSQHEENIEMIQSITDTEITGLQGSGTFEDLQQEIIDSYKETATTIPAHPTLQSRNVGIDQFFIPLHLKKNIPGKTTSERSVTLPEGKIFLDEEQNVILKSLDDLFDQEIVKEIKILLFGGAGTGKSTLLVKVANSCITLGSKPLHGRFELVLWIKLRHMQQSSCVLDAIFDQILARNTKLTKHKVKGFIDDHESRIAFLLDGVDEIPSHVLQSEEGVYRVQDILHNRVLTQSFVLVTTRPHKMSYVLGGTANFAQVETLGFTPQDRDQYIRLNLPDDANMGEALISYLKDNANLQQMAVVPIISQMLCLVWKNQKSLPERITELYTEFAVALFKRRNKDMSDEQVMSNMMSIIDGLGPVALQGLLDSRWERLMFKESEFQSCLDNGLAVGFVQSEKFQCGPGERVLVTFPHKSIQEYFAACHLVKLPDDDENNFHCQLEQIGECNILAMEYLLRFCCGRSRQAAGLILDHIQEMQGDEMELQRLALLLLFESGSEEFSTKLVRPTRVDCHRNEDLKSLSYYLQHVTLPLEGTIFYMDVRKQELTLLREIYLSDSMESNELILVHYFLSEQEEELSLLVETLGVVDEQDRAQLGIVVCIEAKSWFDIGRVSHSFFCMQDQIGILGLGMIQRSPDEVVNQVKALEGCRLSYLSLCDTNLHGRVRDVRHISSSLRALLFSECRLVDDDMKDLGSILPTGHALEYLNLDDNAFSLCAVTALTRHLQGLPKLRHFKLRNIGLDAELVRQVVSENLPHLEETEEGEFKA
ncbi:NACHT, LRR and PYD domains-containing protein 3-like [Patiria miniata]|uniref:NACHT domain-containing protein n=1 Tax=Patiria miniata TaxID=46514 RepID=A0A914AEL2_PATMI|nr:NACHT, LRR and PYD domains-containing protein 3-like [Patiria miniata]